MVKKLRRKLAKERTEVALHEDGRHVSVVQILAVGWRVVLTQFAMLVVDVVALPFFTVLVGSAQNSLLAVAVHKHSDTQTDRQTDTTLTQHIIYPQI